MLVVVLGGHGWVEGLLVGVVAGIVEKRNCDGELVEREKLRDFFFVDPHKQRERESCAER